MPRVCTYYTDVAELKSLDELKLVCVWRQAWKDLGWETYVMGEYEARKHPKFAEFDKAISRYSTVNPVPYERACYLRWLALSVMGGGYMADYDCFPYPCGGELYGLSLPDGFDKNKLELYQARGSCPSLVYATCSVCDQLADLFASGKWGRKDQNGREHWSDQYALEQLVEAKSELIHPVDLVLGHGDPGWDQAPFVHYSNASMAPRGLVPKYQHIPGIRL